MSYDVYLGYGMVLLGLALVLAVLAGVDSLLRRRRK